MKTKGILLEAGPELFQALNSDGIRWKLKIKTLFRVKTVYVTYPFGDKTNPHDYIGKRVMIEGDNNERL